MPENKTCFVVSPIGDEQSETRLRSDIVLNYIIKPVVEKLGYSVIRSDHMPYPGLINNQIIDQLIQAHLVIADMSDHNPNVFYETAIRHVTGKPCIHLMQEGQPLPFDLSTFRTIFIDVRADIAERAKKELMGQIKSIEDGKYKPDNPVVMAKKYTEIQKELDSNGTITFNELRDIIKEIMVAPTSPNVTIQRTYYRPPKLSSLNEELPKLEYEIELISQKLSRLNSALKSSSKDRKSELQKKEIIYQISSLENRLFSLRERQDLLKQRSLMEKQGSLIEWSDMSK